MGLSPEQLALLHPAFPGLYPGLTNVPGHISSGQIDPRILLDIQKRALASASQPDSTKINLSLSAGSGVATVSTASSYLPASRTSK